jgi:hypothetical protein
MIITVQSWNVKIRIDVPPEGHWILGDEGEHQGDCTEVQQLQVKIIILHVWLLLRLLFYSVLIIIIIKLVLIQKLVF